MLIIRRTAKIRWRIGFDSGNVEPVQSKLERKIRTILNTFIPKSMRLVNLNRGFRQVVITYPKTRDSCRSDTADNIHD